MMKFNRTIMEMKNVHYTDRPNAIRKFINVGFSVDDIQITRVDASHYNMFAKRRVQDIRNLKKG